MSAAGGGARATAELIADSGAAAASEEFFRSRPFLDAEGVTHTLRIDAEGGELLAPLIVREIPGAGGGCDAISPYGYPGIVRLTRAADRTIDPPIAGTIARSTSEPRMSTGRRPAWSRSSCATRSASRR